MISRRHVAGQCHYRCASHKYDFGRKCKEPWATMNCFNNEKFWENKLQVIRLERTI
jgi:hypothetical protein